MRLYQRQRQRQNGKKGKYWRNFLSELSNFVIVEHNSIRVEYNRIECISTSCTLTLKCSSESLLLMRWSKLRFLRTTQISTWAAYRWWWWFIPHLCNILHYGVNGIHAFDEYKYSVQISIQTCVFFSPMINNLYV